MKTQLTVEEIVGHANARLADAIRKAAPNLSGADKHPKFQIPIRDELGGVVFRPKTFNTTPAIICGPARSEGKPWFSIRNEAKSETAEILIYDFIGKDYWSDEGVGAKDFSEALAKIPKDKNILVKINSPGGNVRDGIAIYTELKNRGAKVTTYVTGAAISIASVIALAGAKVHMARTAQLMIHEPWSGYYVEGTKKVILDFAQKMGNALDNAQESILRAYMDKTGKSKEDLTALMEAETWFTGDTALASQFVDTVTDDAPISNSFDLSNFKRVPEAFRKMQNSAAQNGGHLLLMNRQQIIARLKKLGITVDDKSTDEQLIAQLDAAIEARQLPATPADPTTPAAPNPTEAAALVLVQAQLKAMKDERDKERRANITTRVDALIQERRVVASERDFLIESSMTDERHLTNAAQRPQVIPPEGVSMVECTSEAPSDIANHVRRLSKEIGADISSGSILAVAKAIERARAIRKNESKLIGIWNEGTNTVDTTLKQDVLLDIGLRAFARVMISLSGFSTMFSNVPLRGTDIVTVPFLDLETAASTDYVSATGYVAGDTTRDKRQVTINKRKYQGLSFTSSELARQPFLMIAQTFALKGEKLAYDVWLDILSLVKAATYAQATKADATAVSPAALGAWDANKIADLQQVASELNWPIPGRMLFVNAALDNQLKKDNALKLALNLGGSDVMRQGKVPNIYGFNYTDNANIPSNGESLIGFIAWKTALLIATSPIPPTEAVVRDGTLYSMAVDPDTGIAMEYRSFGDSQKDKSLQFIECNYGYAGGNAAALKRIATA